jgi:hypothetical protein
MAQVDYKPDSFNLKIEVAPSSETSEYLLQDVRFKHANIQTK